MVNLQKQENTEDTSTSPSLDGSVDSEEQASSSSDLSRHGRLEHQCVGENFQTAPRKSAHHKSRSGRAQGSNRNTAENHKSDRNKARKVDVAPPCPVRKQKSSGGTKEKSHTKKAPVRCSDCGASFTFQSNLHRHRKLLHSEERPFSCTVCDRKFAGKYKLNCHM